MRMGRRTAWCGMWVGLMAAGVGVGGALQRGSMPPPSAPQIPSASTPSYSGGASAPGGYGAKLDGPDDSARRSMDERRGNMLALERQRLMVKEAGQLVQVAAELQVELAKGPEGVAREDALKRIDIAEKLARNVKERMKGGR